jgi:hypothetical protein
MPDMEHDDSRPGRPAPVRRKVWDRFATRVAALGVILLFSWAYQRCFLVGVTGSDNLSYAETCMTIANGAFHFGQPDLYATRWLFMYPPALLFRWVAVNELTAAAYPMACSLGVLLLTYLIGRRFYSTCVGLLAASLLAICPIFVSKSTTLLPDVPLTLCMTLSVYLFLLGNASSSRLRWMFFLGAGMAIGAGWLVKETAVILLVFYVVFFLFNWRQMSLPHMLVFVGAGGVFLVETAMYGWFVGNPLFRLDAFMSPRAIADSAQYTGSRWDYIRKMFVSINEFGFLFYLLLAAFVYAWTRKRRDMLLLTLWFFTIFLYINFGTFNFRSWEFIWSNARYLLPALVPVCLLVAIWLHDGVRSRSLWLYCAILAVFGASSFGFACFNHAKLVARRDAIMSVRQCLADRSPKTILIDSAHLDLLQFYLAGSPARSAKLVSFDDPKALADAKNCYAVTIAYANGHSTGTSATSWPAAKPPGRQWKVVATQTVSPGGAAGVTITLANHVLRRMPAWLAKTFTPRGDDWKGLAEGGQVTVYYVSDKSGADAIP